MKIDERNTTDFPLVKHDETFRVFVQDGSFVSPRRSSGRVDERNVDQVKESCDEDKVETVAQTCLPFRRPTIILLLLGEYVSTEILEELGNPCDGCTTAEKACQWEKMNEQKWHFTIC